MSSFNHRVESLRSGLDYHLARHNVLVSNLAQADTPAYTPVDLARDGFEAELGGAMKTTHAGHLPGASVGGSHVIADQETRGADGNGVDIEREAVKIASNQIRYDMLAQLASSELASLSWAASDGRGG